MLIGTIGDSISESDAVTIVQTLYTEKVITRREGDLMLAVLSKETLSFSDRHVADQLRARILVSLLNRLRFES